MTQKPRPSTFDDALKILDEALVKQQMPDLTPLLGEEFNAAKSKIEEVGRAEFKELQAGFEQAKALGKDLSEQAKAIGLDFTEQAKVIGQDLTADLNKKIQDNPWPIIGGIAIGAAAFGFLLGQRNREK